MTYSKNVRQLTDFLKSNGMPQEFVTIRREHVEAWTEDFQARRKTATANNRFRVALAFFRWAGEDGEAKTDANPMANMRPPGIPEPTVKVLTVGQLKSLLKAAIGQSLKSRRNHATPRSHVATGAHRSEITNLRFDADGPEVNDIDLNPGTTRVVGKGGRNRPVPLDPRT